MTKPKAPTGPSRFEPRQGDLVDFPVLKEGGQHTEWVPSVFQQSGKGLIVRIGSAAFYIDKNFLQMHNIAYNGTTPDGKRKFTVFLRPVSQRPQGKYEVELITSSQTVKLVRVARSPEQALTLAVIAWCKEAQIPEHKYRIFTAHFQHRDPGYDYKVRPI